MRLNQLDKTYSQLAKQLLHHSLPFGQGPYQ